MVTALFCFSEKVPKFKRNRLGLITNFVHQKEEISAINMKHQTTYLECLWYLRCISKVGGVTGYCKTQFLGIFNQHLYEMHTSISHLHTFTMKPRLSFFFFFFFLENGKKTRLGQSRLQTVSMETSYTQSKNVKTETLVVTTQLYPY